MGIVIFTNAVHSITKYHGQEVGVVPQTDALDCRVTYLGEVIGPERHPEQVERYRCRFANVRRNGQQR